MMVLVNLTINSSGSLFVTVFGNIFVYNRWSDRFMNGSVMMTSLVPTDLRQLASGRHREEEREKDGNKICTTHVKTDYTLGFQAVHKRIKRR